MKKLVAVFLVVVMCASLAACGGPDKQPAIDAFNQTSAAFNEVAAVINENSDMFDQSVIDTMVSMANLLNEYSEVLSSSDPIEEETLNEMIEWFGSVDTWVESVKTEIQSLGLM